MSEGDYALYRYFDGADTLLYIGKSGKLAARTAVHVARSRWMQFAVRSSIERHPGAGALAAAERAAIKTEAPVFNRQHNDTPEARERLRAYLEKAGRLDLLPADRERPVRRWLPGPGASEDLLREIAAIRAAFDRIGAAFLSSPDAAQAFRDASTVGNLGKEMGSEIAELRGHLAGRLVDAGSLSIAEMAQVLGISRSRAYQLVSSGQRKAPDVSHD